MPCLGLPAVLSGQEIPWGIPSLSRLCTQNLIPDHSFIKTAQFLTKFQKPPHRVDNQFSAGVLNARTKKIMAVIMNNQECK